MKIWVICTFIVAVYGKYEEYEGWTSYYVVPYDYDEQEAINLIVKKYNLDVYGHPAIKRECLVMADPDTKNNFTDTLEELGIKYRIHTKDMKAHFELEDKMFEDKVSEIPTRIAGKLPYNQYNSVEVIHKYMDDIATKYPDVAKVVTPANSSNGLPIKYMKISTTNFEDSSKPIVFLDGGMHGREWISIPPVTYAIHKLVENVTDPDLLNKFDWILLPIVNPDGYQFSRDVSVAWKKTRSTFDELTTQICPGVDIDRNFNFVWNNVDNNDNQCSYFYPGTRPFSEVETTVIRDILHEHKRILMYISFSSFGNFIMYPWAYDGSLSEHAFMQHIVGVSMAEAMNAIKLPNFFDYRVGNAGLIRGAGLSGTSVDYAHSVGVPLAYYIELPALFGGYWMNTNYIEQVVMETWQGIKAGVRKVSEIN